MIAGSPPRNGRAAHRRTATARLPRLVFAPMLHRSRCGLVEDIVGEQNPPPALDVAGRATRQTGSVAVPIARGVRRRTASAKFAERERQCAANGSPHHHRHERALRRRRIRERFPGLRVMKLPARLSAPRAVGKASTNSGAHATFPRRVRRNATASLSEPEPGRRDCARMAGIRQQPVPGLRAAARGRPAPWC